MNKFHKAHWVLRQVAMMKRRVKYPFKLLFSDFLNQESYFPEMAEQRKSKFQIFWDQFINIMKNGDLNYHYFTYGFDIKGFRNMNEYFDEADFLWRLEQYNRWESAYDYRCILRDKRLFATLLSTYKCNTPPIILDTLSSRYEEMLYQLVRTKGTYFAKPIDGLCGRGAFIIIVNENDCLIDGAKYTKEQVPSILSERFGKKDYIIQPFIVQHEVLSNIYSKSINTMRLLTAIDKKTKKACAVSAVLRIGANGNVVDNFDKGGVSVGINLSTGKLAKYGLFKYGRGTKAEKHPNTNVVFENIEIPYFKEALNQALELHETMSEIPLIGWDVAFTESGPSFIEGNDNMDIALCQQADGGLKAKIEYLTNI